jgi:hypothetical protein
LGYKGEKGYSPSSPVSVPSWLASDGAVASEEAFASSLLNDPNRLLSLVRISSHVLAAALFSITERLLSSVFIASSASAVVIGGLEVIVVRGKLRM